VNKSGEKKWEKKEYMYRERENERKTKYVSVNTVSSVDANNIIRPSWLIEQVKMQREIHVIARVDTTCFI
jgi:hypothetical protein